MSAGDSAKIDVFQIMGDVGTQTINFYLANDESSITRDSYGSIIQVNPNTIVNSIRAFPIELSPTQRMLEKAGIVHVCDAIFYLSKYDIDTQNVTLEMFDDIRARISFRNIQYIIKQPPNLFSQYGDDYLYVVVGGHRK